MKRLTVNYLLVSFAFAAGWGLACAAMNHVRRLDRQKHEAEIWNLKWGQFLSQHEVIEPQGEPT